MDSGYTADSGDGAWILDFFKKSYEFRVTSFELKIKESMLVRRGRHHTPCAMSREPWAKKIQLIVDG